MRSGCWPACRPWSRRSIRARKLLAAAVAEPAVALKRRELLPILQRAFPIWQDGMTTLLRAALATGTVVQTRLGELPAQAASNRARRQAEPGRRRHHRARDPQLAPGAGDDGPRVVGVHRPALAHEHAREPRGARRQRHPAPARAGAHRHQLVAGARRSASTPGACCSRCVHEELSLFAEEAYHETNRFLLQRHVLPEVDLRPFIRRSNHGGRLPPSGVDAAASARRPACRRAAHRTSSRRRRAPSAASEVGEETRLMTRAAGLARSNDQAEAVLGRLNRLVGRQLPDFADHLARAGAAVAAPERGDRRGAGGRRPPPRRRAAADGSAPRRRQHAGAARGAAPAKAGAQAGGDVAGRAGDDRDRRAAVPEHPDGRRDPGDGARLVRAPADAGAARRRLRARFLRHRRASGAPADRPHGLVRDGLRLVEPRRRRPAREGDQARRPGRRGLSRHRPARLPDRAHRVREIPRALLQERERGVEEGRLARRAGRAARDDGDPVHDRAAQDAQRRAGAGRRARVPVPGLGRRAGDDRGQVEQRRRDQGR